MVRSHACRQWTVVLLSVCLGGEAWAARKDGWETFVTAVTSDAQSSVFAGVKRQRKSLGLVSSLVELTPVGDGRLGQKRIRLPKSIRDREARALFADTSQVLLISQWVIEQGDEPQLHRFDRKTRSWQALGTVDCPLMQALRMEKDRLIFECEGVDQSKAEKVVALKRGFAGAAARTELPQSRAKAGEWEAELLGPVFEFDRLELRWGSGKKVTRTASSLGGSR